jgi:formylglycine-generating enzyme required for sulfatase activity
LAQQALPAILWGQCLELAKTQVAGLGEMGEAYYQACLQALTVVEDPEYRSRLFDVLARLGLDCRPGVGLRADGLPDIDWVEIPAGEFIYGEGDEQKALHLETYSISRYPITHAQYQAFIDAGGYEQNQWWQDIKKMSVQEPRWKEANRPRETVSWFEAVAFCRWLSHRLGREVRLPTEQEWEKSARGSDGREFPWGKGYRPGAANINEKWGDAGPNYLEHTSAVGIYPQDASTYGVMDLAGNVWEWCLNKYEQTEAIAIDDSSDTRVLRGGSWSYNPAGARSASRYGNGPDIRGSLVGFRVLCSGPSSGH